MVSIGTRTQNQKKEFYRLVANRHFNQLIRGTHTS